MPLPPRLSTTAHGLAAGLLASALVLAAPARAGSITGSASLRERIALPPDAVFEAVLIDIAIADAPARELGRVRLEPAGQPPFRFTIPYRDSDLNSRGRYAVRATVRQGERLLFTTDTITPVLEGGPQAGPQPPVTLQLVQVGSHRQLAGMFRYLADAASIRLCANGATLPVAMEGDFLRLEKAYLAAQPAESRGEPMLVKLEGLITRRLSAEPGRGPVPTLVVERFLGVPPGQSCPQPLRGQLWRLQALQDGQGPSLLTAPERPPELELAADSDQVSGSGGCNRLMGGAVIKGETIRFSQLASTQMACPAEVMAFERRFGQALERVRRWSIDKGTLLLQDERSRTLLVFQPSM
jgi:heat shock protein HslJ/uncharacterized lipoprotein YbaY